MPTYEYRCVTCEHQFERFQRMSDEPVKVCEKCGEPVKRLLFPVAIQFKGNGFYSTDYARRGAKGAGGSQGSAGDSEPSCERSSAADAAGSDGKDKAEPAKAPVAASAGSPSKSE